VASNRGECQDPIGQYPEVFHVCNLSARYQREIGMVVSTMTESSSEDDPARGFGTASIEELILVANSGDKGTKKQCGGQ